MSCRYTNSMHTVFTRGAGYRGQAGHLGHAFASSSGRPADKGEQLPSLRRASQSGGVMRDRIARHGRTGSSHASAAPSALSSCQRRIKTATGGGAREDPTHRACFLTTPSTTTYTTSTARTVLVSTLEQVLSPRRPLTSDYRMAFTTMLLQVIVTAALLVLLYITHTLLTLLLTHFLSPLGSLCGPPSPSRLTGHLSQMHVPSASPLRTWAKTYGPAFVYRGFLNAPRLMLLDGKGVDYVMGSGYMFPKPSFVRDALGDMAAGREGVLVVEGEVHRRQVRGSTTTLVYNAHATV